MIRMPADLAYYATAEGPWIAAVNTSRSMNQDTEHLQAQRHTPAFELSQEKYRQMEPILPQALDPAPLRGLQTRDVCKRVLSWHCILGTPRLNVNVSDIPRRCTQHDI